MKLRLKTRLSLSYLLLALCVIALISLLSNVFLERQFKAYVISNQESRNKVVVDLISQQFDIEKGVWNTSTIDDIGMNALQEGIIIRVADVEGNTIWDATTHNNGLCLQLLDDMAENMNSRYPGFEGTYMVKTYPMESAGTVIGSVHVGSYGPFYFTDNDLAFINTLNQLLLAAGVMALLLSLIFGSIISRRLSKPLSETVAAALKIGQGQYKQRISEESDTVEIEELTSTINDLAEGLDQQEKLRKRLTADVAHELRTPLATLQSHIEAMMDGVWAPDAVRLGSCHEEVLRITRLVGDLERLAWYESDNLGLNKDKFDLLELCLQVTINFQPSFANKQVKLICQGEAAIVYADRDKLSQVVVNLLANALKYTGAGDTVEVNVSPGQNHVLLQVADSGTGIAPDDLPYIFERFYRADRSRTRDTGGSGVGLAIVKAIIDAHGGEAGVESQPGQGTTFTITLPLGDNKHNIGRSGI